MALLENHKIFVIFNLQSSHDDFTMFRYYLLKFQAWKHTVRHRWC